MSESHTLPGDDAPPLPDWRIYVLADPREADPVRRVRYVGVTSRRLKDRLRDHLHVSRKKTTHVANWIRSLNGCGCRPTIEEIASGTKDSDWAAAERHWINYYRDLGARLTNATDGGEGPTGESWAPEVRAKSSAWSRRRPWPTLALPGIVRTLQATAAVLARAALLLDELQAEEQEERRQKGLGVWGAAAAEILIPARRPRAIWLEACKEIFDPAAVAQDRMAQDRTGPVRA